MKRISVIFAMALSACYSTQKDGGRPPVHESEIKAIIPDMPNEHASEIQRLVELVSSGGVESCGGLGNGYVVVPQEDSATQINCVSAARNAVRSVSIAAHGTDVELAFNSEFCLSDIEFGMFLSDKGWRFESNSHADDATGPEELDYTAYVRGSEGTKVVLAAAQVGTDRCLRRLAVTR